jgi:hypothetical protein
MIGDVVGGGLLLRQRRSITDIASRHHINAQPRVQGYDPQAGLRWNIIQPTVSRDTAHLEQLVKCVRLCEIVQLPSNTAGQT